MGRASWFAVVGAALALAQAPCAPRRRGVVGIRPGIDVGVLANYACVARNVPRSMRREALSWEHHRAVAKFEEPEQGRWLRIAEKEEISSRRLRASIIKGRVVTNEKLCAPPSDPGIPNHIPPINRLAAWWGEVTSTDWLQRRTLDQLEALRRDFAPVEAILGQIRLAIKHRRQGRLL